MKIFFLFFKTYLFSPPKKLSEYLRDQNKETAGEAKRLMVLKGDHIELLKYKREIKGEQGKGKRLEKGER